MLRPLSLLSLCLACLSCETQRVALDENGKPIDSEKKSNPTLEERFGGDFKVQKNAMGIPQASSDKVSSFQRDLDSARDTKESQFASRSFGGAKNLDWRDKDYEGGSRQYQNRQSFAGSKQSSISRLKRPDFMNQSKGLAHEDARESGMRLTDAQRDRIAVESGMAYQTNESRYKRDSQDLYMENKRANSPEPTIYDKSHYGGKTVSDTRKMMGRE